MMEASKKKDCESPEKPSAPCKTKETSNTKPAKEKSFRKFNDPMTNAVLKALSSLSTPEEKLAALCKKYAELVEDNKGLQTQIKQNQKTITTVIREKDVLQMEHNKAILAKDKLEGLCRELQRHNKAIKDDSLARAKEEEERRKEVTSKFQVTINDIQGQMNQHYERNTKLRDENQELAGKLRSLIEQYEMKEEHTEKLFKTKELEKQLLEAKFQQAQLQLKQEMETNLAHQTKMSGDLEFAHKTIKRMEADEVKLRDQVEQYTSRYADFQSTLTKSNEVFGNFKSEMDKMSKKLKKLEKDSAMYKSRWEKSSASILALSEEKARNEQEIATLNTKISRLESLCRALQAERNSSSKIVEASCSDTEPAIQSNSIQSSKENSTIPHEEADTKEASLPSAEKASVPIDAPIAVNMVAPQTGPTPADVVEASIAQTMDKADPNNASDVTEAGTEPTPALDAGSTGIEPTPALDTGSTETAVDSVKQTSHSDQAGE